MVSGSKGPHRRNLWRTVVLSLLAPLVVAAVIVTYNLFRLEVVARKIGHLELADDVNLTLLELRRYEKNILLFRQERDVHSFLDNLRKMKRSLEGIQDDVLSEMSSNAYRSLVEAVEDYEEASRSLVYDVTSEQRLEEDIRPLGRTLEKDAVHRDVAFEMRRYEKNYLIYGEGQAVQRLRERAVDLVRMQPSLGPVIERYLGAFNAIVRNRSEKERTLEGMRQRGRDIQKITMELSSRERSDIDRTIFVSKRLSAAALVFLIVSLNVIGYLFARYVRTTLRRVEDALNGLESGRYAHVEVGADHLPAEIASLISTYNRTIDALSVSKAELERTMGLLEDVNKEIIERQDEIIEVRKLSAMRLLASEIAHEVNNPLSSLSLFLAVMREDMATSDPKRETLSLMMKEATRCQEVIRELASFAKKETLAYRSIDPAKLVSDAIEVVKKQHRSRNVALAASLAGLPRNAVVDPILIHQALVNVLSNAYQFTPDGGSVEVSGRAERDCMTFTISDGGTGISSEHLPYIFEPFFSTRKDGGGSGLGLAITQKIIERHHGSIRAESTPGQRTVFTIELPIEQERTCSRERSS